VGEVEARVVRIDQRALLLHMRAQHLAQRLVHQMGCGVVADRARARGWHIQFNTSLAMIDPVG